MKKALIFLLILFFSIIILPKSVIAGSSDAYMIITNPGEDTSTQMNISWHMDQTSTNGKLIYTTKDDINWANAKTVNGTYKTINHFKDRTVLQYNVNLKNLEKDTEYMYKVGQVSFSDIHYFKTAGAEAFSFVWAGDWHSYNKLPNRTENATKMISKAIEKDPSVDFMLATGDIVAYGSDYLSWQTLYEQEQYKNYMWVNSIGNHDIINNDGGNNTEEYFASVSNFPKNGYEGQVGKSYYFKYGDSLFIVLNTENTVDFNARNAAQKWASNVISNNPSKFVFVALHYQWFSGVTGSNSQYNNWRLFFDNNNVDLAMAGNNHVYVRTHRLFNGEVNDSKGTVYMQTPSTDNDRGQEMNPTYSNQDKIVTRWTEGVYTMGAIIVNVTKDKINTKLIDRSGNIIDEANISARVKEETLDKEKFLKSFVYTKSSINETSGVISCSPNAAGFINKIEYYNEDNLLESNTFYRKDQSTITIPNLENVFKIKVKITYNDGLVDEIYLMKLTENYLSVSNLKVEKNETYKLKWDYNGNGSEVAWVYIDNVALKEIDLVSLSADLGSINPASLIDIRLSNDSLYARYQTTYSIYGDFNLDGKIDEGDIEELTHFILNEGTLTDVELKLGDIDLDGSITMFDVSYIHLFANQYINSIDRQKYNVTYFDYLDREVGTKSFLVNTEATLPIPTLPEGYTFIGWDKDLSNITGFIEVRPIYELNGEVNG